ncbi:hypothetical protein CTAYLR_001076 [Chrysophaeum taylorii]|uniref:Thioredoxin domain-containing protein n=1 Tax=Chrysophaeum taylorii TaxID=2483200 RepID=A0AAD7UFP9_9STRA|nr:hypothetical protein CTAYLR_001076 [Chrysophaeum taylorii]
MFSSVARKVVKIRAARRGICAIGTKLSGVTLQPARSWDDGAADGFAGKSLAEVFGGKKVVLFALPGAFTGVCELGHVPSFAKNVEAFKSKGVDDIVCVSVNDPYTMHAWSKLMGADGISFYGDTEAKFTELVGETRDLNVAALGPGLRSNRYSLLLDDGVVVQAFVEDSPGDLKVSDGDTMLAAL